MFDDENPTPPDMAHLCISSTPLAAELAVPDVRLLPRSTLPLPLPLPLPRPPAQAPRFQREVPKKTDGRYTTETT